MSKINRSANHDSKLQSSLNKASIDNIKKSSAALRDELNAEMRLSSLTNVQTGSKIAKLQEKGTFYAKQIEVEAQKLRDLDEQIKLVQKSITVKRAELQKTDGTTSEGLGKQIKQLERRLEKTLQRHNEILADNRTLKDEIDHLRRERVTFDKIYKKLEVELQDKKKTLAEVYDGAKKAKAKKQNIEEQIKNLKLRVSKEEKNIEREFQDVFRDINEKNVADRIEEKFGTLNDRIDNQRKKKDGMRESRDNNNILEDSGHDSYYRSSVGKRKHFGKSHTDYMKKSPQEEVEEYKAIFESLKKKTNKNDLNEILMLFEDYENKNYSLYQHLSHLTDEKDGLDKQILAIKEEIGYLAQHQDANGEEVDDGKAIKVQQLKDEINKNDDQYKFLENKQQDLTETINALKISIPIIFERIGCNIEEYTNELIDGSNVNEGNMLQYLAIIEKKTNEILQMYHLSQNKVDGGAKVPGRKNEESMVAGSLVFPEKDLLNEFNLPAPDKQELMTRKDFEDYADKKIKPPEKKGEKNY